jgi:ATP-dependent RNA helicase DHX29
LDASTTADTKLLFCTTGILLRKLIGDPLLSSVSHVVIDEVHERTVQSDLLLAMIRNIVYKRKLNSSLAPLKLVLMSATIDTTLLSAYLDHCPVLSVGGRTFEVKQNYLEDVYEMVDYQLDQDNPASHRLRSENLNVLVSSQTKDKTIRAGWGDDIDKDEVLNPEYNPDSYYDYSSRTRRNLMRLNEEKIDYELIQTLLVHIDDNFEEGAVLVFLLGMAEINNLYDQLVSSYHFGKNQNKRDWVMPLHSNISPEEQRRVFKNPPRGIRKFVLATNIAETSITIDDIVYVLDAGHVKERQYDASRGLGMLVEGWISAASAKQRKGRAGRVRPGVCFSLFTRDRANKMRKHPVPEIMRVPLEEVCLHIRKLQLGLCQDFLGSMVQPPHWKAIDAAVKALMDIGALTEDESLTPLGHHLAGLPVDCRIGKLLLLGSILGCLSSILTVAACLSYKTPFASSFEERDAADRCKAALCFQKSNTIASGQCSDHLAMVAAYNGWLETKRSKGAGAARAYARSQHLSQATLYMITDLRKQLALMLQDIGFVSVEKGGRRSDILESPECKYNLFSHNPTFVKNCLCAALYPNIAMLDTTGELGGSKKTWIDEKGDQLFVHPSSVNHGEAISFPHPFLVYLEKIKTKRVYLHDTTIVSPYSLMLFGGEMHILHERGIVEIDNWVKLRVPAQTAVLFKRMRQIINGHLISRLNAPGYSKGEEASSTSEQNTQLMNTVSRLFDDEEKLSNKRH